MNSPISVTWNGGRRFVGFPNFSHVSSHAVEPRQAIRIETRAGDLLSVDAAGAKPCVSVLILAEDGAEAPERFSLRAKFKLNRNLFCSEELDGWIDANGGIPADLAVCRLLFDDEGRAILRASEACTAWFVNEAELGGLVGGSASDAVSIIHRSNDSRFGALPEPLGRIRDEFTVERGTAAAYEVNEGEFVQIIDVEGQQCSDFQACRQRAVDHGVELFVDSTATRSMVRRAYPAPGLFDKFFDAEMRPLLRVVQDTCGRHDTFGLACTARGYEERGFPGHVNCSDNISEALSPYGVKPRVAWPAINFFWNTWVDEHLQLRTEESHSRPGDFVVMQAVEPLICVSTACPDDIDPINGWNPTDIHVRIYSAESAIRRSVGYRAKEDGPLQVSQETPFQARTVKLTNDFAPARDLWTPVSYPSFGTLGEYWACRNAVTIQDMSGLRKFDIIGPDAEPLLQKALTRDVAKLPVWRGVYALLCDEVGSVIDDGTLFRLEPHIFRWCCGSEESGRWLDALIEKHGYQVRLHDVGNALPNLALQGPRSRDLLRRIVFTAPQAPALDQLRWFGVTMARLRDREGEPFLLSRTGYTGELGYEIFCARSSALKIWDILMEEGADLGLTPMGTAALDILRIEAGFAAAGAEFLPSVDAFEAGLGHAVDFRKPDFVGRTALERNEREPRRRLKGLEFESIDVPLTNAPVFDGERQVGMVTSATRSPFLERSVAMARLSIEYSTDGTVLEVGQMDGRMKRLAAKVVPLPFVDAKKEKPRS